ncbi:MAG TPA: SH3 domain-containing protein [Thermomicrobiales bacterium]|nr:SH3 domain-containing protein [Thermomicrobiales bacterium]
MNIQHTVNRRQFIIGSLGAVAFATLPLSNRAASADSPYVVTSGPLNLRSGAGTGYAIIASLSVGTGLDVIENAGTANGYSWVKVQVDSIGMDGYVASDFIGPQGSSGGGSFPVGANVVTVSSLNVRSGPGLGYSVIVALWDGAPCTITGDPVSADGYTWYPIRTGYGTEGWVAGEFLSAGTVSNPAFPVGSTAISTTDLNVRGGAGLSYSVIVTLWDGAEVTITGDPVAASGYTWYPIRTGYGTEGWVAGEFLTQ